MDSTAIAVIDRRIEVVEGSDEQKRTISRVSQLRGLPCVVLLGEPGSGKTTVLQSEARRQDTAAIKVRALINGVGTQAETLFLDALDEYRSDGQAADKVYGLAHAIAGAGAQAWWLSCRAEDWRKEADLQAIQAVRNTTHGQPIVVGQLLSLNHWEAIEMLRALGEMDPEAFLDKAESLGAEAFTHNPLSLRLLRAAVAAEGHWPQSRFDLFESAVRRLAHENNSDRRYDRQRPSHEIIIKTADTANLMLLVSGARALWRSAAIPPGASGGRLDYLTAHDLEIQSDLLRYSLDTALFRGEGEEFEPMHRTIAEFTAARALARAVSGEPGRAAFPLSRAMALITAPDGGPPTELRGLFAWFAAHLAKLGNRDGTLQLIEIDAPTVMSYGDAAVFDTPCRRAILRNLTKATPYFRSREGGSTSVGGLAGEDLAAEFEEILRAPIDGTQRLYNVLEVLASGAPVQSLKQLLRAMVLDPTHPGWVRRQATAAWLNGHSHPAQGRRELFDLLAAETVSESQEETRLNLVKDALDPALTTADLRQLISALRNSSRSHTVGRAMWLKAELEKRPRHDLFDTPIKNWIRENSGPDYSPEINDLLDEALATIIRKVEGLTADRLLQLVMNASWYEFPHLEEESQLAVREWLDADFERELALLWAIRDSLSSKDKPWVAISWFIEVTKRMPSAEVGRRLLLMADTCADAEQVRVFLDIAFHCAIHNDADPDFYWLLYERLSRMPEMTDLFRRLRIHKLEPWRLDEMKNRAKARQKREAQRKKDVGKMTPLISDISSAKRPRILEWGAQHYFGWRRSDSGTVPPGMPAVVEAFNYEVAKAIEAGWRHIMTQDFAWPSAIDIGQIDAQSNHYFVERSALAGLDLCMGQAEQSQLSDVPLTVAISVLRESNTVRHQVHRERLEAWAIEHICRDTAAAVDALQAFWIAALDAGATDVSLLSRLNRSQPALQVLSHALPSLLRTRPSMPAHALGQTLSAAVKCVPPSVLRDLVQEALADTAVIGKSRLLWLYADFSLGPAKYAEPSAVLPSERNILAAFDLALQSDDLLNALDINDDAHPLRRAMIILALGRYASPSADYPNARYFRTSNREEVVRSSINMLGAMTGKAVTSLLSQLMADPRLKSWRKELAHAKFQHLAIVRDQAFAHPSPLAVREALAGNAPVNSADLRAIIREELLRLRRELRTAADSPWREYWDNVGKRGLTPTPKIENSCRDHLILRLRDRMQSYNIAVLSAEMRHAEDKRSDISLCTHAGRTFPIEIKRELNAELWTAPESQLRCYATTDSADGSGLYLVFWFNHHDSRLPARPDGSANPTSAQELQDMLVADLPEDVRPRVDIIVFDVSDIDGKFASKAKKSVPSRRKSKSTQ
jgi:hypothetical protein